MEESESVRVEKEVKVTIYGVKKEHYDEFMAWCRKHTGGKPNIGLHVLTQLADYQEQFGLLNKRVTDLEERMSNQSKPEPEENKPKGFGANMKGDKQ